MKPRNELQVHKRSDLVKWIVVSVILVLLIGAVTIMGIALNKQITTRTLGASAYAIGTLDEQGVFGKDTATIATKDFVTVDGLEIKLIDNAEIQYKVYFYGENDKHEKEFISATEYLTAEFNVTIPTNAKFVKIVIDPLNDDEVSILEISKYAKQLEVAFNC